MSERENLFRPIHKGIRLMLYQMGSGLQSLDFTDVAESNAAVVRIKRDLGNAASNCVLCLLTAHAGHEERDIFAKIRVHDADVVRLVMKEHGEVARRILGVSKLCDEVTAIADPQRRVETGDRFVQELNELIAAYLSHLNTEEATLVPVMWEWFDDEQIRAMRNIFYESIPLPLFETWMRWTLPSMNTEELIVLYSGLKVKPQTPRVKDWVRLAHETLPFEQWLALREGVGVDLPWENQGLTS
ncbi:MAG: hemerythrin domain-containing protein [Thermoplasmata archaeon]